MKKIKILIVRNITVEPIIAKLKDYLRSFNINLDFHISNYDDYLSFFLNKKKINPDYIFVILSVDGYFKSHLITKKNQSVIKKKIEDDFKIIQSFNNNSIITYINLNNTSFQRNKNQTNLVNFLSSILNKFQIHEQIKNINKNNYSKKFWNEFLFPFNSNGTELMSLQIRNYLLGKLGKSFKLLILDADNTLWNGVIGEDGFSNINFRKNNFDFLNFQKEILNLKKKGIILALCTKNNESDIKNFFKFAKDRMILSLNDFVVIKSNWKRKSENINNIIKTINILPEHSAFLDDSVYEINEVNRKIPDLNVCRLIPEKNFSKKFNEFFVLNDSLKTKEDSKKTKMYKQEFKRENKKNSTNNLDQYLKELKIILKIKINSSDNLDRISQLTQKVNQFNSTSLRMSKQDVKNFIKNKNNFVFQVEAKDIYGDYGIIGLAFVEFKKDKEAKISNFLFSCRAIGREIEDYFLYNVINFINQKKKNKIFLYFQFNEKNKVAKEYFVNKRIIKKTNNKLQKFSIGINNFKNVKKKLIKCQIN